MSVDNIPGRGRTILIAACTNSGVIAIDGKIPWKIAEDMNFFKQTTLNHVCVMGSRTYLSIPARFRPLPFRYNVVLSSRDEIKPIPGVLYVVNDVTLIPEFDDKKIFICGGGEIYDFYIKNKLIDAAIITEIPESMVSSGDVITKFDYSGMKNMLKNRINLTTPGEYSRYIYY